MTSSQALARGGVLAALGVAASYLLPISIFGARLFPAQHAINVIAGALLGPKGAFLTALIIATSRIMLGTGTLLAIPGSIFGALLAGLLYQRGQSGLHAMTGEVIGTGILGAMAAWPLALLILENPATVKAAGVTAFVIPFGLSSLAGAILGGFVLSVLDHSLLPRKYG